jgi:Raf kinase inhibitor-like YbhB/YbcL family protein
MRLIHVYMLMILIVLAMGAERTSAQQQAAPPPSKFKMSSAYYDGDWIPAQFTCGVTDAASPELKWSDAPQGTTSLALILHDTDAAPAKGAMDVTHWILWNIPANATHLTDSMQPDASPDGILQGKNVRGVNGYLPPCPPASVTPVSVVPHHYVFELYALDAKLGLAAGSSRADLLKAMDGHVIGKATLVGIFGQGIEMEKWPWTTAKLP